MALGGAWVRTQLAQNMVVFEGRTFGADADAAILGLNGDAGADAGFTTPANWPFTGEGTVSDANLHLRTLILLVPLSDNGLAGAGAGVGFHVAQAVTPWRATVTMNGTPNAAVNMRVFVWYPHTSVR